MDSCCVVRFFLVGGHDSRNIVEVRLVAPYFRSWLRGREPQTAIGCVRGVFLFYSGGTRDVVKEAGVPTAVCKDCDRISVSPYCCHQRRTRIA